MELETIHLVHHSHTDLGYTHDAPIVWEMHRRFLNAALDACWLHRKNRRPDAFRWTVEATAPLLFWLERATRAEVRRFQGLERNGRIEVTAMYANMTPLLDTAEALHMMQPLQELRERWGFHVQHAMNCDVNGHNWGLADVLIDAGVEGLSMAINEHAGGAPLQRPNLFMWEAPSGRRLPVFNGWHYMMGNWLGLGQVHAFEAALPVLLRKLEAVDWPLSSVMIQVTHGYGDNGSADFHLPEFVRRWNVLERPPLLRMSTPRDFWQAVRESAPPLPVHRGDWTDYWNFGASSSARETSMTRQSRSRLLAADMLTATTAVLDSNHKDVPGRNPEALRRTAPSLRAEAWKEVLLWNEHTWGADISVSQPYNEDTAVQWHHKSQHAHLARSLSLMLQRDALAELSLHVARGEDDALLAFNPLPWPVTISQLVPTSLLRPRGRGDDPAASRHSQDRIYGDSRTWINDLKLPACGYAMVSRDKLVAVGESQPDDREKVWNRFSTLTFDRQRGGVRSWIDCETGRERVDESSPWNFGTVVLEEAGQRSDMFEGRYGLEGGRGWKPNWVARRRPVRQVRSHQVELTPAGWCAVQELELEGLDEPVTLRMSGTNDAPSLTIVVEWTMGQSDRPQATYLALPFAMENPVAHLDVGGCAVKPEDEQIPGCCRDYFTVQRWVDLSCPEWGVTIACPDAPLVQLGDFHFAHDQSHFELNRALFLGWMTNNYWDTNFRACQPGRVSFRYVVLPHRGGFDETNAHRFGLEVAQGPVLQSAFEPPRAGASLPRSGSWLRLPEPPILVVRMQPAGPSGTIRLVLLNASDKTQEARIGGGLVSVRNVERGDMFFSSGRGLPVRKGEVAFEMEARRLEYLTLEIAPA